MIEEITTDDINNEKSDYEIESARRDDVIKGIMMSINEDVNDKIFSWIGKNTGNFSIETKEGRVNLNENMITFVESMLNDVSGQRDFREKNEYICIKNKLENIKEKKKTETESDD